MAFCGNCGTKAVGEFCVNCGRSTQGSNPPIQAVQQTPVAQVPIAAPAVVEPIAPPANIPPEPVRVVEEPLQTPVARVEKVIPQETAPELSAPSEREESEETSDSDDQDEKPRASKRLPLLIGGSFLFLGALLFPGSGDLTVVYYDATTEENAAVDLTLRVGGEDIRIAKDANGEQVFSGTWSSFQAGDLKVIPDPKNDNIITISMPKFGSLGIWNINKPRTVTITAYDRFLDVSLTGGDNFSEVGTVSAYRSFYSRDLASCKEDFTDEHGYGINLSRNAYTNYIDYVADAQLDGERTLQYTTWAARADNLQSKMSSYLSLMGDNTLSTDDENLNALSVDVQTGLVELRSAWKNLETVSRNESDSKWDAAWTRIYNAETDLYDKVEAFTPTAKGVGSKLCQVQLNRE